MSASSHTVLSAIWSRARDMLCAIARRAPRSGAGVRPDCGDIQGLAGGAGVRCAWRSTSSRVISPPRPLPVTVARSTPRRFASALATGTARPRISVPRPPPTVAVSTNSSSLVTGMLPTTVPESKSMSGAPVGTMSPAAACSADTMPPKGTGSSTTAFAVSTDTMG
jgi:hypothetical protein